MDTSGYQESDLDVVEFQGENDQPDVDAVFRPRIDTPFSPSTFNGFVMGAMAENSIVIDAEQDKENSSSPPLHSTTAVSEGPTQPPVLMRKCPFGTRIEKVPGCVCRHLFE